MQVDHPRIDGSFVGVASRGVQGISHAAQINQGLTRLHVCLLLCTCSGGALQSWWKARKDSTGACCGGVICAAASMLSTCTQPLETHTLTEHQNSITLGSWGLDRVHESYNNS